jgi:hypothetical protein
MYQNNLLIHKPSGELLRLVKLRKSNINTFVVVDELGSEIIEKRNWSTHPDEQLRIINGFKDLKKV